MRAVPGALRVLGRCHRGAGLWLNGLHPVLNGVYQVFVIYSMVALRDLCRHGMAIDRAGDLEGARRAVSMLVGRDTSAMDAAAAGGGHGKPEREHGGRVHFTRIVVCPAGVAGHRALQGDQHDGFHGGVPDAPVCAIRMVRGAAGRPVQSPARPAYLAVDGGRRLLLPGFSGRKALLAGWRQHALVPGPNSGWSEAAAAGAVQRRLVGPVWQDGKLVTEIWIGDEGDLEGGQAGDLRRMCVLVVATCLLAVLLAVLMVVASAAFR